jgi:hypothetical protein
MSGKGKRPAGDKDGLDGGQVLGKAWAKKYFKITGTAAKCSVGECTTTLKVERGNTSAMARHIRGQHNETYKALCLAAESTAGTMHAYAKKARPLLDAYVKHVVQNYRPFDECEDPTWRAVLDAAAYEANSKHTLKHFSTHVVMERLTQLQAKGETLVPKVLEWQRLAICTDAWTSKNNEAFAGYTAMWVGDDFVLRSISLGVKLFGGSHTSSRVVEHLLQLLEGYGIAIDEVSYGPAVISVSCIKTCYVFGSLVWY